MSTVGELIDRTYAEYLHPADDQPIVATLNGAVTSGATSVVYDDATLGAEEEDLLGPGTLVEVNREVMLVTAVNDSTDTLTVVRGRNGTEAAAHADGDTLVIAPTWTRQSVFEALADTLVGLYPDLWQTKTTAFTLPARTSADPLTDAPSDLVEPLWFTYASGATLKQVGVSILRGLDTGTYTSGIGLDAPSAPASEAGHLHYRASFARPASESVDLVATTGIEASWERLLMVGAVAQLLTSRDIEQTTIEFITEQFESQGFPAGRGQSLREGLLAYYEYLLEQAKHDLRTSNDVLVTTRSVSWAGI